MPGTFVRGAWVEAPPKCRRCGADLQASGLCPIECLMDGRALVLYVCPRCHGQQKGLWGGSP
jgi:hypothetical protein